MQLTDNFSREEMECPCCGACDMDDMFMLQLQGLRSELDHPLNVNSGYRCENHNSSSTVKGKPRSKHLGGLAADISTVGYDSTKLYNLYSTALRRGFKGVGIAKNFVHLDARTSKSKLWIKY